MRKRSALLFIALAVLTGCAAPDSASPASASASAAAPSVATTRPTARPNRLSPHRHVRKLTSAARSQSPPQQTPSPGSPSPIATRHATPRSATAVAPRKAAATQRLVLAAPNAAPQIVSITQQPPVLVGGSNATFTVRTSSNVASVELRAQSFGQSMKRPKIGLFTFSYFVPPLPPLVPHTFAVSFIARNAAGKSVTQTMSITIH